MTQAGKYSELDYSRPAVTVDLVIFTLLDNKLSLLLIRRKAAPFRDRWALPGGFVRVGDSVKDQGEDLDQAAIRELREETNLQGQSLFLEQLYTFGKAHRDPRMRVVTVAYYALIRPDLAGNVHAGSDAADAGWFELQKLGHLPFDHQDIVDLALKRIRGKIDYTPIAFELVPETFTITELRNAYEIIKGQSYDRGNFRRRFNRMMADGIIEDCAGKRATASKPAQLYRFVRDLPR
jgi:8-oxo-dGTP diphosphatase